MIVKRFESTETLGQAAGTQASSIITSALKRKDELNIILATGMSQMSTLEHLVADESIDWSRVHVFHLDEYIGINELHKASFRRYLNEKFVGNVLNLKSFHAIRGEAKDPNGECRRLNEIISSVSIDLALVGIGENGHLAFNDPPADFEIDKPYIIVKLDEKCRMQQVGEGWFEKLEDVPTIAISMSISQIMKSEHIICSVPDERKAFAVQQCLENSISPNLPASILQEHANCYVYLDNASSKLLSKGFNFA